MPDIMRPVPFRELIRRIFSEYKISRSVFGIHEFNFFKKSTSRRYDVFGESCETPVGPAAGPHTQLAQNIVASFLAGGRFFELKTVQALDSIEIEKPCIDAADECYNTEWSSEFTVPKAYDEYLKAWFLLHLMEELFELKTGNSKSFIFNLSAGYDLEGIQNDKVDRFIEDLKDASENELFYRYRNELDRITDDHDLFSGTGLESRVKKLQGLGSKVSPEVCSQLTLSTMHGCPPDEIEKICGYMLDRKKLNTYVKLNPTLLGYDFVGSLISDCGFDDIVLSKRTFENDLVFHQAIPMLKRLKRKASGNGLYFGVKLTNTLGTTNTLDRLPGEEMYMSGRLLFPLSINVAARLSNEFEGRLPVSFSGGISRHNVEEVMETGIKPLTVATDMLKPGGCLRMKQLAEITEALPHFESPYIDIEKLRILAEKSISGSNKYIRKDWRGYNRVHVDRKLPLFDCYVAPCKTACPISQDVPGYIRLAAEGRYGEALEIIYEKNPLPSITGHICAHQCQYNCTRLDYEGSVEIREIKKIALENGFEEYKKNRRPPEIDRRIKAAVIGAGPAGLSAACFLARGGIEATVFDEHEDAGGVVRYNIPNFRIPRDAIRHDIEFIKAHGVKFEFGSKVDINIDSLKSRGYRYILIAAGARKIREYTIEGGNPNIVPSFQFIKQFNIDRTKLNFGREVVVVGAGDTAMDSARAALRVPGVEKVTVVYRRGRRQMPCTEEEYLDCLEDKVNFLWLRNPERFDRDGTLHLRVMELGGHDRSGRRRPVATDRVDTVKCDTLIPSIGEAVDYDRLAAGGLRLDAGGKLQTGQDMELKEKNVYLIGDARTGPSTIVGCIAEARRAADAILTAEKKSTSPGKYTETSPAVDRLDNINKRKGMLTEPLQRKREYDIRDFCSTEAGRCLECDYLCNKCVDVCPNRANAAIAFEGIQNAFQIVHIDAYCNECGNCAVFCPWDGKPYIDKITVFSKADDFRNSENSGFFVDNNDVEIRYNKITYKARTDHNGILSGEIPEDGLFTGFFSRLYNEHKYLFGPVGD